MSDSHLLIHPSLIEGSHLVNIDDWVYLKIKTLRRPVTEHWVYEHPFPVQVISYRPSPKQDSLLIKSILLGERRLHLHDYGNPVRLLEKIDTCHVPDYLNNLDLLVDRLICKPRQQSIYEVYLDSEQGFLLGYLVQHGTQLGVVLAKPGTTQMNQHSNPHLINLQAQRHWVNILPTQEKALAYLIKHLLLDRGCI